MVALAWFVAQALVASNVRALPRWSAVTLPPYIESDATISECGRYRYRLRRTIRPSSEPSFAPPRYSVLWVMLNPSVADATADDPTIRKVLGFSARIPGWEKLALRVTVVNLYALRSTDPRGLWPEGRRKRFVEFNNAIRWDPVGPNNDDEIADALGFHDRIVFAWGGHRGPHHDDRVRAIEDAVVRRPGPRHVAWPPLCLGRTADGSPRHPLMLAYATPFVPYGVPRS